MLNVKLKKKCIGKVVLISLINNQEKVNSDIHGTRNEKPSFVFKDYNVNFYYNQ